MIVPVNRSRTALTALSMISVLALGACSGDDPEPKVADPSPSATLPSSPSTTPVSGPTEPTMPAAAQGTDAAAAEAFVEFYWEMVNYAQATGDVAGFKALGPDCATCKRGVESIEETYRAGGTIRGGEGSISDLRVHFLDHPGDPRVIAEFTLTNRAQTVDYPGRSDDLRYEGGKLAYQILLELTPEGWRVLLMGKQ